MKRPFANTKYLAAISLIFVTAMFAPQVFAQEKSNPPTPATPQTYSVTVLHINSGMRNEYEEFRKTERIPTLRKGGINQQGVWTTANFGTVGEYVITSPVESLAQFDNPGPIVKALGQDGARAQNTKQARFIADSRTYLVGLRPDLSLTPKSGYTPKIAWGIKVTVAPGRGTDYEKHIKESVAVIAKTNAKGVLVSQVGLGGNPNEYLGLVLFDSFAEMEKFFPAYSKGMTEAKAVPPAAGIVTHTEFAVYRYLPELSIQPPLQKAENK